MVGGLCSIVLIFGMVGSNGCVVKFGVGFGLGGVDMCVVMGCIGMDGNVMLGNFIIGVVCLGGSGK